jgi:hypothetical protein
VRAASVLVEPPLPFAPDRELYAIEAAIRGKSPDERECVRQEQARPLLDAFEIWLCSKLAMVSKKVRLPKPSTTR